MLDNLYFYKLLNVCVVDGDTIKADIDLGFGVVLKKRTIRLVGINAPETTKTIKGIPKLAATLRLVSSPPALPEALVTTKEIFHCCHKAVSVPMLIGGRMAMRRSLVKPEAIAVSNELILGKTLANKVALLCHD